MLIIRENYNMSKKRYAIIREEPPTTGIGKAIQIMGSGARLGEGVGVGRAAVSTWYKKGYVPRNKATAVEILTGVPYEELIRKKK